MKIFSGPKKHISILTYLVLLLSYFRFFALPSYAVVDPTAGCSGGVNTALGCIPYDMKGFTGALLGFLAGIAGAISLVIMLVATIQIMTGGDNAEQVKKGKELFTSAIIGLIFIIFSVTLMQIVAGGILKIPGFS